MDARRVVFTFDQRSLEGLEEIRKAGRFPSKAETVRRSLELSLTLQLQAEQGFTDVILRNPKTGEERVLILPGLTTLK